MNADENSARRKKIIVTGDLALDWLEISQPFRNIYSSEGNLRYNWQAFPGFVRRGRPGGALLLAEFVKHAAEGCVVYSEPEPDKLVSSSVIQAFASLDSFPESTDNQANRIYRLKEWKGVIGPEQFSLQPAGEIPPAADLIIISDAGNGFRDEHRAWEKLLEGDNGAVIVKMSRPLGEGLLWQRLTRGKQHLTLIVEADDLRMMGVKISRCLSWERTAQDLVWQMAYNREISFLHAANRLIVRFGADGAVLYDNDSDQRPRLFFDPRVGEEGFGSVCPGSMIGTGDAFTAGFAAGTISSDQESGAEAAVVKGISCMKRLWQKGFGSDINNLDYQYDAVFKNIDHDQWLISSTSIPAPTPEPDQVYWCILEELPSFVETIALNTVITGSDEALEKVPLGRYGNLVTLDRSEIESFNSIKNLVREYLFSGSVKRPLNIGVFGPPGSGKSFGVTEVVKSIDPGKVPGKPLEFNLSQFRSPDELITAFHKIRDEALKGVVPLVFFDEFDSELNGEKLGWLKYFLSPMQDGVFRDGEVLHPLGRAVFVFAGGTRSTFEEFSEQESSRAFKDAKGSDFVSRLRGFINIKGPNPVEGDLRKDRLAMIRRATVLRVLLKKHAPVIFEDGKKCRIDRGVLQAFIKVPFYKHGIRSMQSIVEMSSLSGRDRFEQAALPSPEQLMLHVDAEAFKKIVIREVIFSAARDNIAREIHEKYRDTFNGKKEASDPAMQPWDKLPEELKLSNLGQADHILEKLRTINCDFIPVTDRKIQPFSFSPEEIEHLSELEHERFVDEKAHQGWVQGETRDNSKKIRTDMVPWDELPEEVKEFDRNAVKAIPELLAKAGLEIYRLE